MTSVTMRLKRDGAFSSQADSDEGVTSNGRMRREDDATTHITKEVQASEKSPSSADDNILPTLLGMPAELRNRIYRCVLIHPPPLQEVSHGMTITHGYDSIEVNDNDYQQPALLRTCTQIRAEASGIYYLENQFSLSPVNYDSTPALSFLQHARRYLTDEYDELRNVTWPGESHYSSPWTNLLIWLRRTHEGLLPYPDKGTFDPYENMHAFNLFRIVGALEDVPWEKVKETLEIYKEGSELAHEHMLPP